MLGTALSHVPYSSVVALLTSLVHLLHRALVPEPACPVAVAVSVVFVVLVGVAPVFGTVLVVVQLAAGSQPVCSVNVEGVLLAARSLLVEQRRRSSAARHPASCCVCIDNVRSCIHLGSFRTSTAQSAPAERYSTSGQLGDIPWTSASSTHR